MIEPSFYSIITISAAVHEQPQRDRTNSDGNLPIERIIEFRNPRIRFRVDIESTSQSVMSRKDVLEEMTSFLVGDGENGQRVIFVDRRFRREAGRKSAEHI